MDLIFLLLYFFQKARVWDDTVLKSLGYTAEETFWSLSFNDSGLNISTEINSYFDTNYGSCYRLNSNQTYKHSTSVLD